MKFSIALLSLCLVLFLFGIDSLEAQNQVNDKRPKVGLVLSGGGAKGMAHIGVLKILEEVGMPIDYIGGTSMGGIVGGLYAAGYSADELEKIVTELDWEYLFTDEINRRDLSITEKRDKDRYILSFPFGKSGIELPEGIIRGQHIENKLAELCVPVYDIENFNDLPIPFLCITTDIDNGKKVVIREGSLSQAMRASMSIPSVFVPLTIDDVRMVDGGIIDNFPVEEVLDMGADIIIGVDVGYQRKKDDENRNLFSIMEDAMFIYSASVMKKSLKDVDIFIQPDLKGLGTASFSSPDSLVKYGTNATIAAYDHLKSLADSLNALDGYKYTRPVIRKIDSVYLKSIHINGLKNTTEELTISEMPFSVLSWVKIDEILQSVNDIYASNYFDKVIFKLQAGDDGTILIINIEEKANGLFRFGFYYDIDQKATVFLNTTFYNKLFKNTRLSLSIGLGRSPGAEFSYLFDKGPRPAPGFELSSYWTSLYTYSDSSRDKLASFNYSMTNAKIFLKSNFSSYLSIRFGAEWTHAYLSPDISLVQFGSLKDNFWGLFGTIYSDTYDHAYFPTRGVKGFVEAKFITSAYLEPISYLNLFYQTAIQMGRSVTLMPSIYSGIAIGDSIPIQYQTSLGGLNELHRFGHMPFIGYKYYETGNNNVLFARIDLQFEVYDKMYLTLMANAGSQTEIAEDLFQKNTLISGFGIEYSLDTPVGPIRLSLMRAGEKKKLLGYFQLGYWF